MSDFYEFFCPVKIISGFRALDHMPYEVAQFGSSRPMLITDAGVKKVGLIKPIEDSFASSDISFACEFTDVPPDSSMTTVTQAAQMYRDNHCDVLIAVGGGSVIDTAKAVNILVSEGGDDLSQYSGTHKVSKPLNPFVIVPTTAGTGSEVTNVAVITDDKTHVKVPFISHYILPNAAFLDPRMTQTLPPHLTAMTAMDALTHATEAYICLGNNPMSDAYATAAISKVTSNVLDVLDDPQNGELRLELAQASCMAGIAFSNSMVGLVHSLGHATGGVTHLPHGLCMSIYLPHVLAYNRDVVGDRIGELLLPYAGSEVYAATPASQRADKVIEYLHQLKDNIYTASKLPRSLSETGKVERHQLEEIVDHALNDGSIIYNPKEADKEDLMRIVNAAW